MEEDDIGLDADFAEIEDALFDVLEVGGIQAGEVVVPSGLTAKGNAKIGVAEALGQKAHADFVEAECRAAW